MHDNSTDNKHGFDIECKNRTWKFRCDNDIIKQQWIDVIRSCITGEYQKLIFPSKNKSDL